MNDVLRNIKVIRKLKNLSQTQMAERLGIVVSGYGKIENGKIGLSIERLQKIAEVFEMSVDEVMKFSETEFLVKQLNKSAGETKRIEEKSEPIASKGNVTLNLFESFQNNVRDFLLPVFEVYDVILDPLYEKEKKIKDTGVLKAKLKTKFTKNYIVARQISKGILDDETVDYIISNFLKRATKN